MLLGLVAIGPAVYLLDTLDQEKKHHLDGGLTGMLLFSKKSGARS